MGFDRIICNGITFLNGMMFFSSFCKKHITNTFMSERSTMSKRCYFLGVCCVFFKYDYCFGGTNL